MAALCAGAIGLLPLLADAAPALQQGQSLYDQKCRSCHTIGGGPSVGPDLMGVTATRDREWLIEFTVSPEQVIDRGDPIATELVREYNGLRMPSTGVTRQEAEAILDYIEQQSGGAQPGAPQAPSGAAQLPAGDPETGRKLFTGEVAFARGGPACIACHDASGVGALGGGSLSRDLTTTYTTLGEQGLTSVLQTTPFPMMRDVYAGRNLTDQEVADMLAFFRASAESGVSQGSNPLLFLVVGVIGFVVLLGALNAIWARRLLGVRQNLARGGSR